MKKRIKETYLARDAMRLKSLCHRPSPLPCPLPPVVAIVEVVKTHPGLKTHRVSTLEPSVSPYLPSL